MQQGRLSEDFRRCMKACASATIRLYVALPKNREEVRVIGRQLLRSGTSVAAHGREASRARSNAEFCSKLEGALQEADETQLWLELLREDCGIHDERLNALHAETGELIAILVTMVKNTKAESRKQKAEMEDDGTSQKRNSFFQFSAFSSQFSSSDYVWALQDIKFEVKRGEVLGIIGRNGAGKSTLLKILSRVTAPTTGEIRVKGRIASLLEVGTGFHPQLTGRENIYLNGAILGMTKPEITSKLDEIVDFSGCARYLDTPVKRYSSGMIVRLGFAVAAHLEPEILIVDEVLAVGDAEFQKKCIGKMQDGAGHGRTVLFVSHNMAAVDRLCSRSLLLNAGRVVMKGTTEDCLACYLNSEQIFGEDEFKDKSHGEVLLKKLELFYGGVSVSEVFLNGDDLAFEVELESLRCLRHFAVHVGLYTQLGVLVCLCRSDVLEGMKLDPGIHRIRCALGSIPLAAGEYYCNLAFLEKSQILGSGERQLCFRVLSGTAQDSGIRRTPPVLAPGITWHNIKL